MLALRYNDFLNLNNADEIMRKDSRLFLRKGKNIIPIDNNELRTHLSMFFNSVFRSPEWIGRFLFSTPDFHQFFIQRKAMYETLLTQIDEGNIDFRVLNNVFFNQHIPGF